MDKLLSTIDAATYLGVAPTTLRIWRCSGRGGGAPAPAFVRSGRLVRYRLRDLDEWLDGQRVERGFGG